MRVRGLHLKLREDYLFIYFFLILFIYISIYLSIYLFIYFWAGWGRGGGVVNKIHRDYDKSMKSLIQGR